MPQLERARFSLLEAKLSFTFWAKAFSIVAYVINLFLVVSNWMVMSRTKNVFFNHLKVLGYIALCACL